MNKDGGFSVLREHFDLGFNSCLDLLAKQSGEHEKDRCPCGGIILADTEDFPVPVCNECFEPYEKLQQKVAKLEEEINLKDLQIKSLAASDTLKKADLLIAELQQRVKELESEVKASQNAHFKAAESFKQMDKKYDDVKSQLKEAVEVIEFYANKTNWLCESVEMSDVDEYPEAILNCEAKAGGKRARTYLQNKGG